MTSGSDTEATKGEITEIGVLFGVGSWLATVGPILRSWMDGHEERQADLKWLADGIDLAAGHLTKIVDGRAANDPFAELFVGERRRH